MNKKTDVDVIINNKQYTLGGYESEEYLQKVATYLNSKYAELKKQDFYRDLDGEMRYILVQINEADDYFKLKEQMESLSSDNDSKSNEIYGLKHESVMLKAKLESVNKELEALKKQNLEEQKKVIRLEAELNEIRKKSQS